MTRTFPAIWVGGEVGFPVFNPRGIDGSIVGADTGGFVGTATGFDVFVCGDIVGSGVVFAKCGERVGAWENLGGFEGVGLNGLPCLPCLQVGLPSALGASTCAKTNRKFLCF